MLDPTNTRDKHRVVAIFTAIVGVLVVIGFAERRTHTEMERQSRAQLQEDRLRAVAEVRAGDAHVEIWDVQLFQMLIDDAECVATIDSVHFFMADLSDPRFQRLNEIPNLKSLSFYDCSNVDDVMPVAQALRTLESLSFEVTRLSDASLELLAKFPNLKKVHFEQVVPRETMTKLNDILPDVDVSAG